MSYINYYHLKHEPFHITPDPDFLFLSPSHKEALAALMYGIDKRKGIVVVTGEVGVGKTTILRSYLERVDQKTCLTVVMWNATVAFPDLLKAVCRELGLSTQTTDRVALFSQLQHALTEEGAHGRTVALLIDEAQNLSSETLADLCLLSNLETTKHKLIQIVLLGQPELQRKLHLHVLRQLHQRIAIYATIAPLTARESMAYVHHRLAQVALNEAPIFTRRALKRLVKEARGIPRTLNILCDNALITGYGYQQRTIASSTVKEVIADVKRRQKARLWRRKLAYATGLLLGGLLWSYWSTSLSVLWTDRFSRSQIMPAITRGQGFPEVGQQLEASSLAERYTPAAPREQNAAGEGQWPFALPVWDAADLETRQSVAATIAAAALPSKSLTEMAAQACAPTAEKTERGPALMSTSLAVVRIVRQGEYLSRMIAEVYGTANAEILAWVKGHNPHIQNVDRIFAGDTILFPPLDTTSHGIAFKP